MIIHRRTRKNIIIESETDLIDLIRTHISRLKRKNEHNSELIETILSQSYASSSHFRKEMKRLWRPGQTDLKIFGWNEDEIQEEKQNRKAKYKRSLETSLQKTGLTEQEYRRLRSNLCTEFWIAKGFNEQEAILKIKEVQSKNSKKQSNE